MFPEKFCPGAGMRRISMGTRNELLEAVAARYRAATRTEKGRILTEFAEVPGIIASTPNGYSAAGMSRIDRCPGLDAESMTRQ